MSIEKQPALAADFPESDAARLYALLAGTNSLDEFLHQLAGVAADRLDRRLSCGITVEIGDQVGTIASSDEFATALDQAQYRAGAGPCLTVMREQLAIEVTDAELGRWPEWREYARASGLRKMLSMPLRTVGDTMGALNVYSRSAVHFTDGDRATAAFFASQAGGAVAVASRLVHQAELVAHLEAALTSRAVIDQAKGVLMAQERCTADEAFELLRKASQNRNVKLRDVAEHVVARFGPG